MRGVGWCGRRAVSPPWEVGWGGVGWGVSLALVHVLQPAELLQELGPGVAVIPGGVRAWPQSLLQHQAVGPQERVVGALLSQGGRALREERHPGLVERLQKIDPTRDASSPRPHPRLACPPPRLTPPPTTPPPSLGRPRPGAQELSLTAPGTKHCRAEPGPPGAPAPHRALTLHPLPLYPLHLPLPGQVLGLHHACKAQVLLRILVTWGPPRGAQGQGRERSVVWSEKVLPSPGLWDRPPGRWGGASRRTPTPRSCFSDCGHKSARSEEKEAVQGEAPDLEPETCILGLLLPCPAVRPPTS